MYGGLNPSSTTCSVHRVIVQAAGKRAAAACQGAYPLSQPPRRRLIVNK
jgi:hypothetical protein